MSLINETLNNLKQHENKDSVLINPSSFRSDFYHKQNSRSLQNLLIILMSSGIVITLFYIAYHLHFSKYLHTTQEFFSTKSAWVVNSTSRIKQKLAINHSAPSHASTISANVSVAQMQYYDAMNLLNEGNEEKAKHDLKLLIAQYPDFAPAQNAYAALATH